MNYYNEFDPKAAAWIRELIRCGHIPPGEVDERSICDINPGELNQYIQCHFFAGIGGWSLALALAGWPSDRPVWTGSCPCQPFSTAGKQLGTADERHLWPVFFRLIAECRPVTVFGEQVASSIGKGWLDGISADLEREGYACGATVLGAHSVGAPHIRQRLYWVANSPGDGREQRRTESDGGIVASDSIHCGLADANPAGRWTDSAGRNLATGPDTGRTQGDVQPGAHCPTSRLADDAGERRDGGARVQWANGRPVTETSGRLGDTDGSRFIEQRWAVSIPSELATTELRSNAWDSFDLLPCTDGKARRIESGTFPLAHGVPGRVGLLRGYGNAIVPQAAAEFVKAFCQAD